MPQSNVSAAAALAEKPPTARGLVFQRIISNHPRPFFKQPDKILSNRFEDSQSLSRIGTRVQLTKALVSSVARPLVLRLRQARYEYDETNEYDRGLYRQTTATRNSIETKGSHGFMVSICSGSYSCRGSGSVSDSPRSPWNTKLRAPQRANMGRHGNQDIM